jgi:hypothetical protein
MMRYTLEDAVDLSPLLKNHPELETTWEDKTLVVRGSGNWTPSALNGAVLEYLLHIKAGVLEIRRGKSLEDAYMAGKAALEEEDAGEEDED